MLLIGLVPLVLFLVLLVVAFRITQPGAYIMDPDEGKPNGRTFMPHLTNYVSVARLIIGLAAGSIAALTAYVESVRRFSPSHVPEIRSLAAWPLSFFGWCVIFAVFFVGILSWRYESYCQKPGSYTRGWYALVWALGFSALASFALAYLIFGLALANP